MFPAHLPVEPQVQWLRERFSSPRGYEAVSRGDNVEGLMPERMRAAGVLGSMRSADAKALDALEAALTDANDGVRIEELRVRGQTQRLVVRPKGGAAEYEIIPADGGRNMVQAAGASRGAAGARTVSPCTIPAVPCRCREATACWR